MTATLFTPITIGTLTLPNRVVMAPLARLRNSEPDHLPSALAVEYYKQRASAGLIITEATDISPTSRGYAGSPGIHTSEQIRAWRAVTDAVHLAGGRIAMQLWHTGRVSHHQLQPNGTQPVAPSAIRANTNTNILGEKGELIRVPADEPRPLTIAEIKEIVADFAKAALNAKQAGFDFVELHGAHGYLLNQFLSPKANVRTDEYGGTVENRARFLLDVVDAVIAAWDGDYVGIRISPLGDFNGLCDLGQEEMAYYLIDALAQRKLAYLHLSEPDWAGSPALTHAFRVHLRTHYAGVLIAAGGYTLEKAEEMLGLGLIDAVAFGRTYIANPDLVERLRLGAPLNEPDPATFYGGGAEGYTDYPTLAQAQQK